jgi:hypothetical protein
VLPQSERYYVDAHPKQRERVRRLFYEKSGGKCAICGDSLAFEGMHLDHIIPLALGGEDAEYNLQATHAYCNRSKAAKGDVPYVAHPKPVDTLEIVEVAARLGQSPAAVRLAIKRGSLKADRVGGKHRGLWLVPLPEVERYERENRNKRGTSSPRHPGTGGRPRKPKGGQG